MKKADLLAKLDALIEDAQEIRADVANDDVPDAQTRGGDDRKPPPGSGGP